MGTYLINILSEAVLPEIWMFKSTLFLDKVEPCADVIFELIDPHFSKGQLLLQFLDLFLQLNVLFILLFDGDRR